MIHAEVICDSASEAGFRLTTMKLRYPKFIHGEFMTHRVFSRNASSSWAIPVSKMIAEVRDDATRAQPVFWGAEQKGMQSGEELEGEALAQAQSHWGFAGLSAVTYAERMVDLGVHKSIVNRVLEPYLHINVVVTATEWDNFFGLRLDKVAQPEMRVLAEAMWAARGASQPRLCKEHDWHLPFIDGEAWTEIQTKGHELTGGAVTDEVELAVKVSVARCARVSYESFETGKKSTLGEDLNLFQRLMLSGHWSPFEHQATPDIEREWPQLASVGSAYIRVGGKVWVNAVQHGNLKGWRQFRKMIDGEAVRPLPEGYTA